MGGKRKKTTDLMPYGHGYEGLVGGISELLDQARRSTARAVNSILTATYWEVGRRIVEYEQGGSVRAAYGAGLWKQLADDLTARFGRGFSKSNLAQMRGLYMGWGIFQTPSGKMAARVRDPEARALILGDLFGEAVSATPRRHEPLAGPVNLSELAVAFPLPWSHYVRLMSVGSPHARAFYESEAVRGGWSVRQLDRQVSTQFYERTGASKQKAAMIERSRVPKPEDAVSAEETIRDPYLLEFLGLKDEHSESDLEGALVRHLETFLLELGAGFTFVARQKRIRIDTVWYRMDLLLFHRKLRCLVVVDLKIGPFTHADAGQMNLYLNYAKEHLCEPGESEPVGIILCSEKSDTVVRYATAGMNAQVFASRYLTSLPSEAKLRDEIERTKRVLDYRKALGPKSEDPQT